MLDIGFPKLNGIEAARRIRKLRPESKILFLSQETSADIVQETLGLGAVGYVAKPYAGSELLVAMETVCGGGQYFTGTPYVRQLYFSAADPSMVIPLTKQVHQVIQSRHRPESNYVMQNLTSLVGLADRSANALTLVSLLIAIVTLLVGGIGIMNIMLATVTSRVHEIGIRKAIGATNAEIRLQFLSEAALISLVGSFRRRRNWLGAAFVGPFPY